MSRPRALALALALSGGLLLAAPLASAQCAMCKATVEASEQGRAAGGALNRAILLLLAGPYAVFGACAAVLFRRRIAAALQARLPFGR